MNWIVTYYNRLDHVLDILLIENRTEHEATNEAMSPNNMPMEYADWTLMPVS